MPKDLRPEESDLAGRWRPAGARVEADEVALRVEWLVTERLQRVAADASGWDVLYHDPRDGRLWELTYPESSMHGGGPPRLTALAPGAAAAKYGVRAA